MQEEKVREAFQTFPPDASVQEYLAAPNRESAKSIYLRKPNK